MKTIATIVILCVAAAWAHSNLPKTFVLAEVPEIQEGLKEVNVIQRQLVKVVLSTTPVTVQDCVVVKFATANVGGTQLTFMADPITGEWHLYEKEGGKKLSRI